MRIVFAVTNDLTYDRRMHRICATLQKAGNEVTLVGRKLADSKPLANSAYRQVQLRCFMTKGPLFYAEYNFRLFFLLLRMNADVFGACDLDTAPAVVLAGKLRKRRLVFDAHEHFAEVPEVERRPFVKKVWQTIGKWCVPRFDIRYTVGDSLAQVLAQTYGAPFSVIRNLPLQSSEPVIPPVQRSQLIVYIGALNEGRGLEYAIGALQYLPGWKLKLVGEGDLSRALRELVKETGVTERVQFAGRISPGNLPMEIASGMLGLNVLEARSKSYYYSLSNKFFDYMQAGIPSISMEFPEYTSILSTHKVGIAIPTLSARSLADAIQTLMAQPDNVREMIEQCVQARTVFSWEHEEQRLTDLFRTLDH